MPWAFWMYVNRGGIESYPLHDLTTRLVNLIAMGVDLFSLSQPLRGCVDWQAIYRLNLYSNEVDSVSFLQGNMAHNFSPPVHYGLVSYPPRIASSFR